MSQSSTVDVIIPVFNGGRTIVSAINSVLSGQGSHLHKIIVVNDGSDDNTAECVKSFANPLVELICTPNQGVAKARNLGIEKATADWVAFLDADDLWMPGKLDAQLQVAFKYGADFICGSGSAQNELKSSLILPQSLAQGNFIVTSSVLVKRSLVQRMQPVFTPKMTFAEDYLAWLKCVTLTKGYYIGEKHVEYSLSKHPRYHLGQIMLNITRLNFEYARFLRNTEANWGKRYDLSWTLFKGSIRSVLSIVKRFVGAYGASVNNK